MKINSETDKRNMLLYYVGSDTRKILKKLDNTGVEGQDGEYTKPKAALQAYFVSKMNKVYLMNVLQNIKQSESETVDSFYMRVKAAVAMLNPETMSQAELIELLTLSQLVNNCTNTAIRKKALKDGLKLCDFLDNARAYELTEAQTQEIEKSSSGVVNATRKRFQHQSKREEKPKSGKSCYWCGGNYPHTGDGPAKSKKCSSCGKLGHYEKVCRSKKPQAAAQEPMFRRKKQTVKRLQDKASNDDDDSYDEYIFSPHDGGNQAQPWATVNMCDTDIRMLVDTGSTVNIIDSHTYQMKRTPMLRKPGRTNIYAYGSHKPITMRGKFETTIIANGSSIVAEVYVTPVTSGNILCCDAANVLGLVHIVRSTTNISNRKAEQISSKYPRLCTGIGKLKNYQVKLHIDYSVKPVAQGHRRVPFHLRKKVEQELEKLESQDIIERVDGPTPWVSPIVTPTKPNDPNNIRLCVDMREANEAVMRECHLTPTIDDIIHDLNGNTIFSKLDLRSGYHQLELHPDSRYITTFSTHAGLWRYKRLNFGISSASEVFQNTIQIVLQGIPGVCNISDDIFVFSKPEDHHKTLVAALRRLHDNGLTINLPKCEFYQTTIKFYGYIFSKDGLSPDPEKVAAVHSASTSVCKLPPE